MARKNPPDADRASAPTPPNLTEWFTSPTEAFDKYALGYEERLRLYAQLADVR